MAFNSYRILGGIGVGLASAIVPVYIAEIAPSGIRGTLVSCNQFAIIFGMLVVYFVNYMILGDHTNPVIDKSAEGLLSVNPASDPWTISTGWRYMFGSEAYVAVVFGILLFFVPKTPRYLVLIGQDEKALSVLTKVNGPEKAKEILNDIQTASKEKTEKLFAYGAVVVVIGILLSVFQQAIGINAVLYYSPRIFESAGAGNGMIQTVIMGVVNIVFAVAIAVAAQWIFNYLVSSTFPPLYDFSPMAAYGLYGIMCVSAALFVWKWVPETKGKTLEDLTRLWKKEK